MGKVAIPKKDSFVKKVAIAVCIMFGLILLADILLISSGNGEQSMAKAIGIVTNIEIINESIDNRYLFTLLSMLGEVVQFYMIYVVLEYLLEGKITDMFTGVKYMNKAKSMNNHFIVAGGGRVGSHAAKLLKEEGKEVVVIDTRDEIIEKLRKDGFTALKGDMLDEKFQHDINIEKAKFLVACLGSDSDNILMILTAKELNPSIKISARANSDAVVGKLRQAGAHSVVVPSSLGGEELAKSAERLG